MLLGGKVELPRHLAPHVTAAWDRLAVHIVGDVAGFPTGLAKLVTHFAIFVQCGHLSHRERTDAVRLMCQYFPPASVMATFAPGPRGGGRGGSGGTAGNTDG